jgi:hypothetical protein
MAIDRGQTRRAGEHGTLSQCGAESADGETQEIGRGRGECAAAAGQMVDKKGPEQRAQSMEQHKSTEHRAESTEQQMVNRVHRAQTSAHTTEHRAQSTGAQMRGKGHTAVSIHRIT